jgi:hypothetical protein
MQRLLTYPSVGLSDLEANPSFNVVIAYEDVESGKNAQETCDFLAKHLGPDFQFSNQIWKFDALSVPRLRELAAEDAVRADLVIISSRGRTDLPVEVKNWIEQWLAEKRNVVALAAIFGSPSREAIRAPAIRAYLADAARRGRMEFFAQQEERPASKDERGHFGDHRASPLDEVAFSMVPGAGQPDLSFPRWGINE